MVDLRSQADVTLTCHPERSLALLSSRRILAGAGRREGSAFCGTAQKTASECLNRKGGASAPPSSPTRKWASAPEATRRQLPARDLLHEPEIRVRRRSRTFRQCPKLCFKPRHIFLQRLQQPLRVRRAQNYAGNQLPLRHAGKQIYEIQGELFAVVMDHRQIRILPQQFLFVRLDLHLLFLLLARWLAHSSAPLKFPRSL